MKIEKCHYCHREITKSVWARIYDQDQYGNRIEFCSAECHRFHDGMIPTQMTTAPISNAPHEMTFSLQYGQIFGDGRLLTQDQVFELLCEFAAELQSLKKGE